MGENRGTSADESRDSAGVGRLHLRFGWWALLTFLSLGIVLEGMHGFKVGWYLDVSSGPRRIMLTLAHAHGTLLALINIAFAVTVATHPGPSRGLASASRLLLAATVLLPMGFLAGGLFLHAGDPGLGRLLVPLGGVVLFLGVLLAARSLSPPSSTETGDRDQGKGSEQEASGDSTAR